MSEFTDYLHEVFSLFGPVTMRRMFNGHTLYHQGLPIGIVYDETLYLKADAESAEAFKALGLSQFTYDKRDKIIGLPYYQAPDFILEDRGEAALWARRAYAAALRSQKSRKR